MSKLLDDVVRELSRLPGIGRRTALRLALHILRSSENDVAQMISAIGDFRTGIRYCTKCNNLSDNELCEICANPTRDRTTICVVEQAGDVLSIEKTGQYRGLYHVLGGVISPMAGISPSDLKIDLLINNIANGRGEENGTNHNTGSGNTINVNNAPNTPQSGRSPELAHGKLDPGASATVKELILAISTTVEGETTLFYIMNRLRAYKDLKITTIARGIGFGDEIEYADELTISHAIANRRELGL